MDVNVTVQHGLANSISVQTYPANVNVGINGIQGPIGPQGLAGSGGDGGFTGDLSLYLLRSETGIFYTILNTSGYISGFDSGLYYLISNPNEYVTSGNLNASGQALIDLLNNYTLKSETGNFLTSQNLNGFIVSGSLNSVSGELSQRLGITGSNLINLINGLSGQLNQSGQSLYSQILNISNNTGNFYLKSNPLNFSSSGNVANTGQAIILLLDNYLLKSQTGQFYHASNPQGYLRSGEATNTNLSGYITTGQADNRYYTKNNESGFLNSLSGLSTGYVQNISGELSNRLTQTGANLLNLINASSAGVSSVNSASGIITINAAGSNSVITNGSTITISGNTGHYTNFASVINLENTGLILNSKINSLSGYSSSSFYLLSNPSGYLNSLSGLSILYVSGVSGHLQSQINDINSKTGAFVTTSVVSGYITTGQADVRYYSINNPSNFISFANGQPVYITGNQTINGAKLFNDIIGVGNGLSDGSLGDIIIDVSNKFLMDNQPAPSVDWGNRHLIEDGGSSVALDWYNKILSGQWTKDGNFILTSIDSGNLNNKINNLSGYSDSNFATIINLQSTGVNLFRVITGLSGQSNINYALISNLTLTGQSLINLTNSNSTNISGNLYSSGNILDIKINSLSGNLTGNYLLRNQTGQFYPASNPNNFVRSGEFISGMSITGSNAIQGALNINAGSNITLTRIGDNNFTIASTASSSSSAGITGISITGSQSITGLLQLTGIGGLLLIQNGNSLSISGGSNGGSTTINNYISSGGITGAGNQNFLPKFDEFSGLINSNFVSIGQFNGINVTNPTDELEISGTLSVYNSHSNTVIYASGNVQTYQQFNIQNLSSWVDASTDIVVTSNVGTETTNYVNLGINSSNYTGAYVGSSGDAYLYSQANDLYIGNTNNNKSVYIFAGGAPNAERQANIVIDTGAITFNTSNINFLRTTNPKPADSPNHTNLYIDNLAQRSILSYANSRGIGKMIQNTFALESVHNFVPNTTTTMSVLGTTATSAGTLSHLTQFREITGFGYSTSFLTPVAGGPAGIQSATTPFFISSGITGVGAGFFYAAQFQVSGANYEWPLTTGIQSGFNFFAGMTNAASIILSTVNPWPTAALLGFQFARITGVSGRNDSTFKFVAKDNGATAPFYIQETNCPFNTMESYTAYIYARTDFRNGIHWMIKPNFAGGIYSGDYTGQGYNLPLVRAGAQILLKPTIGFNYAASGLNRGRMFKLKGMYCETV